MHVCRCNFENSDHWQQKGGAELRVHRKNSAQCHCTAAFAVIETLVAHLSAVCAHHGPTLPGKYLHAKNRGKMATDSTVSNCKCLPQRWLRPNVKFSHISLTRSTLENIIYSAIRYPTRVPGPWCKFERVRILISLLGTRRCSSSWLLHHDDRDKPHIE